MPTTRLTVVIPTLNRHDALARTLARLRSHGASEPFAIHVVADAAETEPERVTAIGTAHSAIVLRATKRGASAARNVGWRAAGSELILFLGDDIAPAQGMIDEHLTHHARHPEPTVGVLGHVRWAPGLRVTPFMRWLEHGFQFDYPNIVGEEAGWGRLYTANVSLKREMLDRVDGFDEERFPFLYEDLDLGKRMAPLGFRLLYNRDAVGEHDHEVDLGGWRVRARQIARAERAFVQVHPDVPPFFHDSFREAQDLPRARGRGRHLLRAVTPHTPWIGKRAWRSADLYYRQALASDFLDAWNALA